MQTDIQKNKEDLEVRDSKIVELEKATENVQVLITDKADLQDKLTKNEGQVSDLQGQIDEF